MVELLPNFERKQPKSESELEKPSDAFVLQRDVYGQIGKLCSAAFVDCEQGKYLYVLQNAC